jgi:hypothetical protein
MPRQARGRYTMSLIFDCHILGDDEPLHEVPTLPDGAAGAILFGPHASARRRELSGWAQAQQWGHAEPLDRVVGQAHAVFPTQSAQVVELQLAQDLFDEFLKRPREWWPVCDALRNSKRVLKLKLPPGQGCAAGIKQVVKHFFDTHFWIDPFVHGPVDGWQAQVRLATQVNLSVSTLGLFPGPESLWDEAKAREALHFLVGEVGAARLLFASGESWAGYLGGKSSAKRAWLEQSGEFDNREMELVFQLNAKLLFIEDDTQSLSADL